MYTLSESLPLVGNVWLMLGLLVLLAVALMPMAVASTKERREQRFKLVKDARAIAEKAKGEARDMSAAETEQFDKMMDQGDALQTEIDKDEKNEARTKRLEDAEKHLGESAGRRSDPGNPEKPGNPGRGAGTEEREFRYKLRQNPDVERVLTLSGRTASDEYRRGFGKYLRGGRSAVSAADIEAMSRREDRALQADSDVDGGFLNAPQQMAAELLKAVDDAVPFRQFARVFPLQKAESLGVPTLDTDVNDAEWTTELKTGSEDTALKFGKRELNPQPIAKRIKISRKLLRTSVMDVESLVRERFAYKFGVTKEKAYMTGTGANQPLGVFTAHADGISTGRDIATANTTTTITPDGLIEAKYFLKPQYWPNARWLFHRTAIKQVRLAKDGQGQYIWLPGLQQGQPDRILDLPVTPSEWAPNTFTTGKYVGLLGDFRFYWIAQATALEMQRLEELYAETNQIGFIAREEEDGMPVLEEAFVRIKLL